MAHMKHHRRRCVLRVPPLRSADPLCCAGGAQLELCRHRALRLYAQVGRNSRRYRPQALAPRVDHHHVDAQPLGQRRLRPATALELGAELLLVHATQTTRSALLASCQAHTPCNSWVDLWVLQLALCNILIVHEVWRKDCPPRIEVCSPDRSVAASRSGSKRARPTTASAATGRQQALEEEHGA